MAFPFAGGWGSVRDSMAGVREDGLQRLADALQLGWRHELLQDFDEARLLPAARDVSPAVRSQDDVLDRALLGERIRLVRVAGEVIAVGAGLDLQHRVDGGDELDEVIHSAVALTRVETLVLAAPFELVEDRVLRLLLPVEEEDVLTEGREVRVGPDARPVMRLREDLDVQRERQHAPRRLAQDLGGDAIRLGLEGIAGGHLRRGHLLEPAKERLVLQLLFGETHQRFERDLVAEAMVLADFEDLRADEALDQSE